MARRAAFSTGGKEVERKERNGNASSGNSGLLAPREHGIYHPVFPSLPPFLL
jgi:hypothetical protein